MNEKLMKIMKRQGELALKAASGEITDEEKSELEELNAAIEALTSKDNGDEPTELTTMTVAEFKEHVAAEQAKSDLDPARLSVLKRNIESVRKQGKTEDGDVVAVEVLVEQTAEDRMDAIEEKLDQVLSALKSAPAFDGRTGTGIGEEDGDAGDGDGGDGDGGDGDGDGDAGDTNKGDGDAPTATALANEALDAIITRFQSVKDRLANGEAFTVEELYKMWPGYELRELLEGAIEVMSKLDQAKALIEEVTPALKALDKDGGDGDADDGGDGDADDGGDGDAGDGDGDGVSKWAGGGDLSPRQGAGDEYRELKKRSKDNF
jgi:hypothetical protein